MLITSWDDYSYHNWRLADLLQKYSVEAIFFIELQPKKESSRTHAEAVEQIKDLHARGFEIGSHTWNHPADLKMLDNEQLTREIYDSKSFIEGIIDMPVDSFCYPRGRYDDRVIEAVRNAGYTYARTTQIGDCMIDKDPLQMATSCHVFDRNEYNGMSWFDYAIKHYDHHKPFHLWGHAWEVEQNNQWDNLEKFFKYVSEL